MISDHYISDDWPGRQVDSAETRGRGGGEQMLLIEDMMELMY